MQGNWAQRSNALFDSRISSLAVFIGEPIPWPVGILSRNKVLRLLVAGQKLVKMFWLDRHRVVPFVSLPTEPPHTIFLTLPAALANVKYPKPL